MRTTTAILAAIIGLALATAPAVAEPARIAQYVDGDTIWLEYRNAVTKVRFAHYDSPEVGTHARCEAERVAGERSSAYVRQLLPIGTLVDVTVGKLDKWNRPLVDIRLNGMDVVAHLLARGDGTPYEGRGPKAGARLCP